MGIAVSNQNFIKKLAMEIKKNILSENYQKLVILRSISESSLGREGVAFKYGQLLLEKKWKRDEKW